MATTVEIKSWNSASVEIVREIPQGKVIGVTTKPSGADNCWLEVGQRKESTNGLGRKLQVWEHGSIRYARDDGRLVHERKFSGSGKAERQHWEILVPNGFPDIIVKNWGGGEFSQVWPLPEDEE
jgi:hypothetical protein